MAHSTTNLLTVLTLGLTSLVARAVLAEEPVSEVTIREGDLSVLFRDNSESPGLLSGVQSLRNVRAAPEYDAFDPDSRGSSAGLNFEHIISGHADQANKFAPRHGPYRLYQLPDGRSVELRRRQQDSPWAMSSTMRYRVTAPDAIDFEFRCTPHDAARFKPRGYAIFFWADYMNQVDDVSLHFIGVDRAASASKWIAAPAPGGHDDYVGGGTYRSLTAEPLAYDRDHNFKLNVWSYDYPRFSKPFYVGRAANGMMLQLMFDRCCSKEDEIRFSLFKFKVHEDRRRPAWDFQYVIHKVEQGRQYGYRGRLVWKPFVSYNDCLDAYEQWSNKLRQ
jgi:hypothetical protein